MNSLGHTFDEVCIFSGARKLLYLIVIFIFMDNKLKYAK